MHQSSFNYGYDYGICHLLLGFKWRLYANRSTDRTYPAFGNLYVIGWSAVNFFILLALLYKFAYGPIYKMLDERTASIEGSLKHAEEVRLRLMS